VNPWFQSEKIQPRISRIDTDAEKEEKKSVGIRVNPWYPWFQSKQRIQPRIPRIDTDAEKEKKKSVIIRVNPWNPWFKNPQFKNPWFNTDGETVWALRDVSFSVEQDKVLVVGKVT
jgi:hypothetical protein